MDPDSLNMGKFQLELYLNELTRKLPVGFGNLGNLTSLEYFDASTNYLNGDLSEIRFLNQQVSLQLFKNEFTGELQAELDEFKKLVNVSLHTNKLTGQLSEKLGCKNVEIMSRSRPIALKPEAAQENSGMSESFGVP
ncbi:receptor-like protein kinase HAIKU2 [Forsythia ovata]|uniref:Receptor-like protein kinase HAIKU2 n=1 Tax=Forsythia ovata TaxID=205694 RepID=A0ABD1P2F4_9LAMI